MSNMVNLVDLLPPTPKQPDIWSSLWPQQNNDMMSDLLKAFIELDSILAAIKDGIATETEDPSLAHHQYLTPQTDMVKELALEITDYSDSDTEKMQKIEKWVHDNISYKSDAENYGESERWAFPIETLRKKSGDCEDQAFLVHSLGLAARVSPHRLRTYGGLVYDPNNTAPGGHGWTAFQRDDGEWVTIDTTYYYKNDPINNRAPMSDDLRYIDDFWYIQSGKTVSTPYANKVRYAANGSLIEDRPIVKGWNINVKA